MKLKSEKDALIRSISGQNSPCSLREVSILHCRDDNAMSVARSLNCSVALFITLPDDHDDISVNTSWRLFHFLIELPLRILVSSDNLF